MNQGDRSERSRRGKSDSVDAEAAARAVLSGRASADIDDLNADIEDAIRNRAPHLLERYGVGPDTASALLLTAGDNSDRLTSEAAFAALCGVSPVEASSGKTQRRRLNRGGDRIANSAPYTIVLARLRWESRTQPYVQ